ncbi:MAG: DEAD/DEAH box helicase family protein, partial [Erysipelotrichaceae bacterium]|nr:DEAD/DEAH box helicase family protein [Erysipelotrichaceae bacterium]
MNFSNNRWSLIGYEPRPQQIDIINEILHAMDQGYKNIILEAGTGIGKSSIATTIANYVDNSYIITMTNQLLQQYLHDFKYMVKEIKGKDNYPCRFSSEDKSKCMIDEVNKKKFDDYNERLSLHEIDPIKYPKPEKPTLDKTCGQKCPFIQALNDAMESNKVITNYDFLYYGVNFANILKERELLILDESHNLEQKIMNLTIKTLNRKTIYQTY